MSAEIIPFPRRETPEERLMRDILADEQAVYAGGIDDLPFEELGDRPRLDLIVTEPKR